MCFVNMRRCFDTLSYSQDQETDRIVLGNVDRLSFLASF